MRNIFFDNSTVYIKNGKEYTAECKKNEAGEFLFSNGEIELERSIIEIEPDVYSIKDTYKNLGESADFIFVLDLITRYKADFTLIPAVSYDGNRFGNNGDPKGLTYEGEPWVFGYSRTTLPAATITEGDTDEGRKCVGLFASTDSPESLVSGGSIYIDENGYTHQRIYRPEVEAPKTYAYRDGYGDPRYDTVPLKNGESFTCTSFVVTCEPKYKNFGAIKVYDVAAKLLDMTSEPAYNEEEIWDLAIDFADTLRVVDEKGALWVTGLSGYCDGDVFKYKQSGGDHELGWCGQNSTLMYAHVMDYVKNGNKESLEKGLTAIETWLKYGTRENGWIASHIRRMDNDEIRVRYHADTVNTGYGTMQLIKLAELLRENEMTHEKLEKSVLGMCELYVKLFSEENGMPSAIAEDGTAVTYRGSGGMFAGFALSEAYKMTKDTKYLETTKKLLRYYTERDLNQFATAAGALDTSCVDKESCTPFLYTALELYELTGEKEWIEIAEKAAVYLATWMFMFDVIYPEDSDFVKMGFNTKGGTVVSAQHQHTDPWGDIIASDMAKYAKLSGNKVYATFAKLMWDCMTHAISDGVTPAPRNHKRPRGAQTEAYMHTHWSCHGKLEDDKIVFGSQNDWLTAWPSAHRMATLMRKWRGEI